MTFEVIDPRFRMMTMGNAWVEKLAGGCLWAEGPVWFAEGEYLLWSDIPNDRMLQWAEGMGVRTYRHPANNSNGNTRDREGRLVSCEHGARRVSRTERYGGKRLNSPNDVVVKSDGSIWFTDPPYGIMSDYEGHKAPSELGKCYVFRIDPRSGELAIVADDFDKPNGLAFSPDESLLYVADTGGSHTPNGPRHIRRFTVGTGGKLAGGEVFATCTAGLFDGFRLDTDGNLWSSAGDGVHCIDPRGHLIGKVLLPYRVSNLAFGGPMKNRLFILASHTLYAVFLNRRGVQWP